MGGKRRIVLCVLLALQSPVETFAFGQSSLARCSFVLPNQSRSTRHAPLEAWWSRSNVKAEESTTKKQAKATTFQVPVKPRQRVTFDPDTGRITSRFWATDPVSDNKPWESLKQTLYGVADVSQTLPSKLSVQKKSPTVLDGYACLEKSILSESTGESPGQRLMRVYKQRAASTEPTITVRSVNSFDSFKEKFYDTLDAASRVFNNEDPEPSDRAFQSYQPVVRSSLATSKAVREALPDVTSTNPVRQWNAVQQIRKWEERALQEQLAKARERERKIKMVKESIYKAGDTAQKTLDAMVELPAKVAETAAETQRISMSVGRWLSAVPETVTETVENVTQAVVSIPTEIEKTVTGIQTTVEEGIATTKQVVQEVQAIPGKVIKTVEDTTRAVDEAVTTAKEAVTTAKVIVGLEKPKPKPPKVPPPVPTASNDVAWKVLGSFVSSTAKVAWWASKNVALLTWKGLQTIWAKVTEETTATKYLPASEEMERPEDAMPTTTFSVTARIPGEFQGPGDVATPAKKAAVAKVTPAARAMSEKTDDE